MKKIIALFLVVVLMFSLVACGEKSAIKDVTKNFEKACNKLDVNKMLDCINPTVANGVRKATSFVGLFTDKDVDDLLDVFSESVLGVLPENANEMFSSLKLAVSDVEIDEDTATATFKITYSVSGEKNEDETTFDYMLVDGKWYISNLNLN